jgi:hypothetical protein
MHFKSQRIDARVDHAIATIDITQVYLNELETPVEATYQIPFGHDKKNSRRRSKVSDWRKDS